ncbi:unnamed protein product [Ranitomeya imitator]|uniref:NADH dehydrogenase [ubiquinone] 1 beta subcomplex subunit 6 n=1 Tax=Ranitomeya imitator TaxID=111125 RepID=A0ABN9LBC4_9NEOB|nr:unnamed protein product [Ranitomeya imitator]
MAVSPADAELRQQQLRALRRKWLKDQELSPREPVLPEKKLNAVDRFWANFLQKNSLWRRWTFRTYNLGVQGSDEDSGTSLDHSLLSEVPPGDDSVCCNSSETSAVPYKTGVTDPFEGVRSPQSNNGRARGVSPPRILSRDVGFFCRTKNLTTLRYVYAGESRTWI